MIDGNDRKNGKVRISMNFIYNLEKKFGKYTIQNLSLCLIICYGFGYAINFVNSDFIHYLSLNPARILHGEVWRVITWILVPPDSFDLFTVIMLYFYYSIGTTLERTWGSFLYNLYIFSGIIFTILGSFLLYGCMRMGLAGTEYIAYYGVEMGFRAVSRMFSTYYINMSIFLAFAATFPDVQVLLMFLIPIKVKWLGILDGVLLASSFFFGGIVSKFVIGSSLISFLVFFLLTRNLSRFSPKQIRRRSTYKKQMKQATGITKHKCAICGRTELDDPNLEFRFCSKCDGNYEYCQDHLFTHTHIKKK